MDVYVTLGPDQESASSVAAAAEDAGFDGVSWGEHLFFHGATPNAFVALAAAAGATARIRLLTSVVILPLYPAALAAKLAATLDRVSNGRLDLGVGVGGEYPAEFEAAGVDVRTRGRRSDEALEVLRRLFAGTPVYFDGDFTRIRGEALQPPPVQRPGPPVWLGGRRPAAMRRAGRFADVWFPYMYSPEQLAESLAQVRAEAERAGRDPAAVRGAVFCWGGVDDADGARSRREVVDTVSGVYQQDFDRLADRYLLHGTPDDVAARIREYRDAGAETLVFSPVGDGRRRDEIVATFGDGVLPRVR
ncbi:LLM class flavin-dependent oxidoreductase [Tomitella fengzijianii]|uniref:LLM class flavin-dependent oxidoreductase n=1 Tax=Tomitella fengzijianii TaxID=2597660 RepID=A0A516WZ94_9ACTN|nr:LLM class flavin-dependent oxidoreductase [Tomitella fengzijianii]QDQ96152.1 LLM class flavin-dependent oxidoreductase [Tomitella fengzijianii]